MKSISTAFLVCCISLCSWTQTVYTAHVPCGSVRYFGYKGDVEVVWSRLTDTTAELSYTDIKQKATYVASIEVDPLAQPLFTGSSESFDSISIDLRSEGKIKLAMVLKSKKELTEITLAEFPSSVYIPVDYECFTALRSILYDSESGADSVSMTIEHSYPVPAKGCTKDDSLRFIAAVMNVWDETTVDMRYPDDIIKNIDIRYVQDYTSMYESGEAEVSEVFSMWSVYDALSVLFQKAGMMGLVYSNYEYTGGAHGSYGAMYYVYDFTLGRMLTLEDLFSVNYEMVLEAAIDKKIRSDFEIGADASLMENGFFVEVVPVVQNFTLSETEITFQYNIYEIAPYSAGSISVSVPYSDIRDIIAPGGPVERMME